MLMCCTCYFFAKKKEKKNCIHILDIHLKFHSRFRIMYYLFSYLSSDLINRPSSFSFVLVSFNFDQWLCRSVMKMILFLFQLCSLSLIHKAESTGCLKKLGFGIGLQSSKKLVDGQSSFSINLSECENRCENLVSMLYVQKLFM